jgi:hypothetical protein
VQIGCDRGSESRRNAGLWEKGRGFESGSLQQRVHCELVPHTASAGQTQVCRNLVGVKAAGHVVLGRDREAGMNVGATKTYSDAERPDRYRR